MKNNKIIINIEISMNGDDQEKRIKNYQKQIRIRNIIKIISL